jgi:Protein of unknown function (DUF3102)
MSKNREKTPKPAPAPTLELSNVVDESARLDQLAAEIKQEHEAVEASIRESLLHAKAAGEKLLEAKDRLQRGEWMPWVEAHCGFSHSTALLYVNVARRWDELVNSQPVENLTLHKAATVLAELRREVRAAEKALYAASHPTKDAFHNEKPFDRGCRLFHQHTDAFLQPGTKEELYLDVILHDRTLHHGEIEQTLNVVFGLRRRVNTAIEKLRERMAINVDECDTKATEWREEEIALNLRIAEVDPALLNLTTR